MVLLDYAIEPSEAQATSEFDLASADDIALDFGLFCGSITLRVNGSSFDADWGWVPVLSFAVELKEAVASVREHLQGTVSFTESDAEIVLIPRGSNVRVTCNFNENVEECPTAELGEAVAVFCKKVVNELSARWPELRRNQTFCEKARFLLSG